MTDPGLNKLLNWAVRNADQPVTDGDDAATRTRGLDADALKALMGGPSDAELMVQAMQIVHSDTTPLDAKLTAFDNFEQLVEGIDNANNMESLKLWTPLAQTLDSAEPQLRLMGAWCISTAVQNNTRAQDKVVALDLVQKLVALALHDPDAGVRKKAVNAISSEVRNYQPGLNEALRCLPAKYNVLKDPVDAGDMDAIDKILDKLRADAAAPR